MGDHTEYMEQLTVGAIVEGKVKSLTKFGAFVTLPDGSTGMVHISEIAYTYVNDIRDHLHEGDTVKVMVISMENGKTNLSIKRTIAPPPRRDYGAPRRDYGAPRQRSDGSNAATSRDDAAAGRSGNRNASRSASRSFAATTQPQQPKSFDDMLKQFMTESDSKMSSIRAYSDRKTKNRRR